MTRLVRNKLRPFALAAALVCAGALASGCSDDGEALKKSVLDSLNKQAEIKSYAFSVTADLNIGALPAADANPLASGLLAMMQNGKLEFNGTAATEPARLEASLKSASAGLELPLILNDNKLYVNFPPFTKKDEYLLIDLTKLGAMSGQPNALTAESLRKATQTASSIGGALVGGLDPKWFNKGKNKADFADGTTGAWVQVDITDKNKKAVSEAMRLKLPDMIDKLAAGGFISKEQAGKLNEEAKSISVDAPGKLAFAIDEQGFAREQQIEIAYTQAGKDGLPVKRHLRLNQKADSINKEPAFTKSIPSQVKPFEDVLRLLLGGLGSGAGSAKTPQK